jgi:hypothetical protein
MKNRDTPLFSREKRDETEKKREEMQILDNNYLFSKIKLQYGTFYLIVF